MSFAFLTFLTRSIRIFSKRVILSEVSRLFDPLGLLGPAVVLSKLLLQDLWQLGIHWDKSVPLDIGTRWNKLKSQFGDFNRLKIPRWVKSNSESQSTQIHGFYDASQRAYGACPLRAYTDRAGGLSVQVARLKVSRCSA